MSVLKGSIPLATGDGHVQPLIPSANNMTICTNDAEPLGMQWKEISSVKKYFYAYGPSVDTSINSGNTAIGLTTEVRKDSIYTHGANDAEITITQTGDYLVNYDITANNSSILNPDMTVSRLSLNTGNGFSEITGSISYISHQTSGAGTGTCSATIILSLNIGDIIRIEAERSGILGNISVLTNGTRLVIESL